MQDLAGRLSAVSDMDVRVRYVDHELRRSSPDELAACVAALLEGGDESLLLSLSLAITQPAHHGLRAAAAAVARERGELAAATVLAPQDPDVPEMDELRVPDFGGARPLTLGERKSLARKRDRKLIARVLRDPDPVVIGILLRNPTLTESDVLRVASRRPVHPDTLVAIFRSTRWVVRYRVRRALLQNPYTPLDVALQLVPHLNAQDARTLARAPDLRLPLRQACSRRVAWPTLH